MGHFKETLCGACVALVAVVARADIFQWEYINPADPNQGKQQSTRLVPDGKGVDAVPGAYLAGRDLSKAYLIGADLKNTRFESRIEVSGSHLLEFPWGYERIHFIDFRDITLTDADFTGADVRGASFSRGYSSPAIRTTHYGPSIGVSLKQLYSTASYQAHDLQGINLTGNFLTGGNFAGQNLTKVNFTQASLTGADFIGAQISGASFTADFASGTGISVAQLYSTANYQARDLSGISLAGNDLSDGNFASLNLTSVNFSGATLTGADFTNAVARGASFGVSQYSLFQNTIVTVGTGISHSQLYSTASYQAHDLSGIGLSLNNLAGANFARQNLTNAYFYGATLTGADFTSAEVRGANFSGADLTAADARGAQYLNLTGATTANLVRPDGHVDGLDLNGGRLLVVRDYHGDPARFDSYTGTRAPLPPIPITVDQHLAMGLGGVLQMLFDAGHWDSTISFAPGIPVTLGGVLELTYAPGVNLAGEIGRTFDLFDWTGVNPTGAFTISSPYAWDLSSLYTTGEVTLTAVPEPASGLLIAVGFGAFVLHRRWRLCQRFLMCEITVNVAEQSPSAWRLRR